MGTEYRLLGPVEVRVDGDTVDLGPGRQRTVFAALLVDAGRLVPTETLVDRVWDDDPPGSSRSGLYSYITRLRRVLDRCGEARLVYGPGGYRLDVDPAVVDLHRFRDLYGQANHPDCPDPRRAALLGEGLRLWDGQPMADLTGGWVTRTRETLVRQRLDAVLLWAGAQLRLGGSAAVIEALRELVGQYPLVEPLAARLIEALRVEGRTAEALEYFGAVRRRLADELGIDPGDELRQQHAALLRGGTGLGSAAPAATADPPAQLPMDVAGFVGRRAEIAELDDLLAAAGTTGTTAVVVSTVAGTAGVGKPNPVLRHTRYRRAVWCAFGLWPGKMPGAGVVRGRTVLRVGGRGGRPLVGRVVVRLTLRRSAL